MARAQRDVHAAAKAEADSQTLKSLVILDKNRVREADFVDLEKHREINGRFLGQSCEMT